MDINTRPQCPIQTVTQILGDKWSLLILRNLILDGPHRFQDFVNAMPGLSPTTLSNRLKTLQDNGLIARVVVEGYPPRTKYELTELGRHAQPMMRAIREFGGKLQTAQKDDGA